MFHNQGTVKNTCNVLAVLCGARAEDKRKQNVSDEVRTYPFPEIASSGRLEVQTLKNPTADDFKKFMDSWQPNVVYIQGELLPNGEIGSLSFQGLELFSLEALAELFSLTRPTTVYLELANGERLAESLNAKGIPYVIYWKSTFSRYAASYFHHSLLSAIQSSSCHAWDAFRLARACYRIHCLRNDADRDTSGEFEPYILGEAPKIHVEIPEMELGDEDESSSGSIPAIKIYDDHISLKFLICGVAKTLDAFLLSSLEDGLNALLSIEMRVSKLHNRASALPPPLQSGTFSRGVVTMRCDISTSSSTHISLLVSGSAQTCFDDLLLENHIKSEIIENSLLVHAPTNSDENKPRASVPRKSIIVACGAPVFQVCMKVPMWASQVLKQLCHDVSYKTLVALGVGAIQGLAVSSFEQEDADRILFFYDKQIKKDVFDDDNLTFEFPPWLVSPPPFRRRSPNCTANIAALRPVPHIRHQKMVPFSRNVDSNGHGGGQTKANLPITPPLKLNGHNTNKKSASSSQQAKPVVSLNPLPLKKHNCGRSPLHVCTEEEFLKDVMQFLILRGHNRLIPQGGLAEFPEAILNAKRLDLFNLYCEVVTRGGFHVGNGINWKGQVFSKMRNHTVTNRMTGVGNTLKRHYETYLLEYELAHDDVDGECCLLCRSSAPGDWVNCGLCGEWAHFGCDRRPGLGAFKDYAKTDGLEYICPQCSVSNYKKKASKT